MVTRAWPCPGLLRLCRHARGGRGHCARRAASEFADVHISQRLLPTPFWVAREVKDYRLVRERAIIAYNGWIVAREGPEFNRRFGQGGRGPGADMIAVGGAWWM